MSCDPLPAPWDDLTDALGRLEDAERHGSAEDVTAARAEYERARDRLGLVAAAIFAAAVGMFGGEPAGGYVLPKTWLAMGDFLDVSLCFDLAKRAKAESEAAVRIAKNAVAELEAIRDQLREIEDQVADLTPGVGPPGFRFRG